jgi:hypothetical protein
MSLRCATCGYRSDDPDFFRGEKGGLLGRRWTVCDACSAYQPSRREKQVTIGLLVWPPIWLVMLLAFSRDDPGQALGLGVLLLSAALSLPMAIAIHEGGHALAAAAVGRRIVEVLIGRGPPMARLRIASATITLGRYVLAGGLMRSFAHDDARSRWRDAVVLVAGAGANALAAGLAFWAGSRLDDPGEALGIVGSAMLLGIAFMNAGMGAMNILPWKVGGEGGLTSDGARLLQLSKPDTPLAADNRRLWRTICLNEMGRFAEMETVAVGAIRGSNLEPVFVSQAMSAIAKLRGDGAAIDWYLAEGFDPDTMSLFSQAEIKTLRVWLKASVAWHAMKTGRPDLSELVESFSRQAFEALPQLTAVSGTRGAVLDLRGDSQEGLELLLQAARAAASNEEKADFCDTLAAGLRRRGHEARADGFEAVSMRLREGVTAQYR